MRNHPFRLQNLADLLPLGRLVAVRKPSISLIKHSEFNEIYDRHIPDHISLISLIKPIEFADFPRYPPRQDFVDFASKTSRISSPGPPAPVDITRPISLIKPNEFRLQFRIRISSTGETNSVYEI